MKGEGRGRALASYVRAWAEASSRPTGGKGIMGPTEVPAMSALTWLGGARSTAPRLHHPSCTGGVTAEKVRMGSLEWTPLVLGLAGYGWAALQRRRSRRLRPGRPGRDLCT